MDFRVKCAVQHLLSVMPGGSHVNYLLQRYVSNKHPLLDDRIQWGRTVAEIHINHYRSLLGRQPARILELGSGQHLCVAVHLGIAGPQVVATDVRPNAREQLVNEVLHRLGTSSLKEAHVTYKAPYDFFDPNESFDLIVSNDVLEHVPASELGELLRQCRRLLRPGGVCSFFVNYKDHWARQDRRISPHNFLRFSDAQWRLYNPRLQYQNRLRHPDYIEMFEAAGLHVRIAQPQIGPPPEGRLDARFAVYRPEDLSILSAWFTLQKGMASGA